MRKPHDTCEVSEVYDFREHPSSLLPIRSIFEIALISNLNLSKELWCDYWIVHLLSGTFGSITAQLGAHSIINSIHTPIQRKVTGKIALIIYTME